MCIQLGFLCCQANVASALLVFKLNCFLKHTLLTKHVSFGYAFGGLD